MKEHPILFSVPMVKALLGGTKTQTRRIVNFPKNGVLIYSPEGSHVERPNALSKGQYLSVPFRQPYQKGYGMKGVFPKWHAGDLLWVRETFQPVQLASIVTQWRYRATDEKGQAPWKPSIFMPRKASRITLEIVSVRVERLQDISEEDAKADGAAWPEVLIYGKTYGWRQGYRDLWESINGPGSWAKNPWVWCLAFKKL
jgi:hypothetical protein